MPEEEVKTARLPSRNCLGWLMLVLVMSSPLVVIFLYRDAEQFNFQTKRMMKVKWLPVEFWCWDAAKEATQGPFGPLYLITDQEHRRWCVWYDGF